MIILDPNNEPRNKETDELRIHINYLFATYLKEYLAVYNESCKISRASEGAPAMRMQSLVTNYSPEVCISIDCYNDNDPTTNGFLIKADAYSALVGTFVHEMCELGMRPIVELGYEESLSKSYGSIADINIYLGFVTNTKLPEATNAQTEEEIANIRANKVAVAEGNLAVATLKKEEANVALINANKKVENALAAKEAADAEVLTHTDATPYDKLVHDLETQKLRTTEYEESLLDVTKAQDILNESLAKIKEAEDKVKEAEDYAGEPLVYSITTTDVERLTDEESLKLIARRLIEGAYGPPIKTLQDTTTLGISDSYFYSIQDWEPTDARDLPSVDCIKETSVQGSRVRYIRISQTFNSEPWRTPEYSEDELTTLNILVPALKEDDPSDIVTKYPYPLLGSSDDSSEPAPLPKVTRHISYKIKTTYDKQTTCYLIMSARSPNKSRVYMRVNNTEFIDTVDTQAFSVVTEEFVVNPGDYLEIGLFGEGLVEITGVWLSPKENIGSIDNPRSMYNMLPPGYRSALVIDPVTKGTNAAGKVITEAETLLERAEDKPSQSDLEEKVNQATGTVAKSSSSSSSMKKFATSALAAVGFSTALSSIMALMSNDNPAKAALQDINSIAENIQGLPDVLQEQAKNAVSAIDKAALLEAKHMLNGIQNSIKEAKQRPEEFVTDITAKLPVDDITANLDAAKEQISALSSKQLSSNVDAVLADANSIGDKVTDSLGNVESIGGLAIDDVLKIKEGDTPDVIAMKKDQQADFIKDKVRSGDITLPNALGAEALDTYNKQVNTIQDVAKDANNKLTEAANAAKEKANLEKKLNKNINSCVGAVTSKAEEAAAIAEKSKDVLNNISSNIANVASAALEDAIPSSVKDTLNTVAQVKDAMSNAQSLVSAISNPQAAIGLITNPEVVQNYANTAASLANNVAVTVGDLTSKIGGGSVTRNSVETAIRESREI